MKHVASIGCRLMGLASDEKMDYLEVKPKARHAGFLDSGKLGRTPEKGKVIDIVDTFLQKCAVDRSTNAEATDVWKREAVRVF